jgi:hypothetical protein
MTDHQLSTRDLAARPDSEEPDSSLETDPTTGASPTRGQNSRFESAQADASLTRDPAAGQPLASRAADSATDPVAGEDDEPLGSNPGETRRQDAPRAGTDHEPLFPGDQSERFTSRWQEIQTSFGDQPRDAVAEADTLSPT